MDGRVLGFAAAATCLTGLLFGLVPALQTSFGATHASLTAQVHAGVSDDTADLTQKLFNEYLTPDFQLEQARKSFYSPTVKGVMDEANMVTDAAKVEIPEAVAKPRTSPRSRKNSSMTWTAVPPPSRSQHPVGNAGVGGGPGPGAAGGRIYVSAFLKMGTMEMARGTP